MKKVGIAMCFVTVMMTTAWAHGIQNYIVLREQVRQQRAELARRGMYAFVTNSINASCKIPKIHSRFWVDRLPRANTAQIAYEMELRNFGLDFVGEFERLSSKDIPVDDIAGNEARANQMIEITRWLASESGYGNYILKKWSEGLALTAIGALSVNSRYETNQVMKLLKSVDHPVDDLKQRVEILNEESPHRYKIPKGETLDDAQDNLERQWRPHHRAAMEYFRRKGVAFSSLAYEDVKSERGEYAFYVIPWCRSENTVRSKWDDNCHYAVCVCGLTETMASQIRAIIEYRVLVGNIPIPRKVETLKYESGEDFRSQIKAVWRKRTGKMEAFVAADAILTIYGGLFVDHATREERWKCQ